MRKINYYLFSLLILCLRIDGVNKFVLHAEQNACRKDYLDSILKSSYGIFSMPDIAYRHKLEELHDEYLKRAKIKNIISYIFYPQCRNSLGPHAELEVENHCYTIKNDKFPIVSFDKKLLMLSKYNNYLFFRFPISVNPIQLEKLRIAVKKHYINLENKKYLVQVPAFCNICSLRALNILACYGDYSVPFFLRFSPTVSAMYLAIAKKCKSQRVGTIACYNSGLRQLVYLRCFKACMYEFFLFFAFLAIMQVLMHMRHQIIIQANDY